MKPLNPKLSRPRVEGVIERRRLLKRLDKSVRTGVVWITAPAGSGKTTLVADWLEQRKLAGLWYQADESDRDIASFFSYLSLAAQRAAPRHRMPLPLFTPEYRLGLPAFTKHFFEELFSRLPSNSCFVIDNYQDVPLDAQFHAVLRDGIGLAPEGVSVIVISRADPPPAYARYQASGRLELLSHRELLFTYEESRQLIRSREKKKTPESLIKTLHAKTEGWAAGLVLIADSAAQIEEYADLDTIPREGIFVYFAVELFDRTDGETRRFLLASAFLPSMTARTASELTGSDNAEKILSGLSRRNFFIHVRFTPAAEYEYHPLFREFLLKRAEESLGQEEKDRLRKKAAVILLQSGRPDEAASLLIEASDWHGLTALVLDSAKGMVAAGRFLTIGTWIYRLPESLVEQSGWLLYWKALCRLTTRPSEARENLEKAFALFLADEDVPGVYLAFCGIVDTFVYEWKDFSPLDRWIREFQAIRSRWPSFPSAEIEERATSAIFAALMFRQPNHPDMPHWEKRVLDILDRTEDASHRVFIGNNLILYYLFTSRLNEAGSLVSALSPVMRSGRAAPLPKIMCLRSQALYFFYTGRPEEGLTCTREGITIAEETGVHSIDLMLYGVGVYHAGLLGDKAMAREMLDRLLSLKQDSCYASIYRLLQAGAANLILGNREEAVSLTEQGMQRGEGLGAPLLLTANYGHMAFILSEAGYYDQLGPSLAKIRAIGKEAGILHAEVWCAGREALVALHEGNDAVFAERFGTALSICRKCGLRLLAFLPSTLSRLCAKALELAIETEFVRDIIKQRNLIPPDPSAAPALWPWPVRIQTLGGFMLFINDRPAVFPGRVPQKPLALLRVLVAFGGREVTGDAIIDALWPDAQGDVAHQSFDTTLYRLRKIIGGDSAITVNEGRVSLDDNYCFVDTRAFEKASEESNASDPENMEQALSLYRGHFLPADAREPWTTSLRERLRTKFLGMANKLGSYWMERGRYDDAVRVFLKGLDVDDIAEVFYQQLMVCYLRMDRRVEAAKVYQRCRDVLEASLGLAPSDKTEELYRSMQKK